MGCRQTWNELHPQGEWSVKRLVYLERAVHTASHMRCASVRMLVLLTSFGRAPDRNLVLSASELALLGQHSTLFYLCLP
jgi:hypothetical protein